LALIVGLAANSLEEATLKKTYTDAILLIERLHRRFLDVIKTELDRLKIDDINNVQTLILYNISAEQLTIGELTNRGYYLGSNVSYNVKKLVENEYLVQERAPHDKRSTRIKLSNKGLELCKQIDDLYQRNVDLISKEMSMESLGELNKTLSKLERLWTDYINHSHK
jgi:DNA-binding MarR family transcriptional regulator